MPIAPVLAIFVIAAVVAIAVVMLVALYHEYEVHLDTRLFPGDVGGTLDLVPM